MDWIKKVLAASRSRHDQKLLRLKNEALAEFDAAAAGYEADLFVRLQRKYGDDPLHRDLVDAKLAEFREEAATRRAMVNARFSFIGRSTASVNR